MNFRNVNTICYYKNGPSELYFKRAWYLVITSLYILDCLLYVKINLDDFITNISGHGQNAMDLL